MFFTDFFILTKAYIVPCLTKLYISLTKEKEKEENVPIQFHNQHWQAVF